MMKMALTLAIALMICGCATTATEKAYKEESKAVEKTLSDVPKWYAELPGDEDHLYAAGTATSKELQMAVDKAKQVCLTDLGTQMEARVDGLLRRFQEETGLGGDATFLSESTSVSKTIVSTVLIGVRESDKTLQQEGPVYRAYLLMELPLGPANRALVEKLRQNEYLYTRVRATDAFEELKLEVENIRADD